MKLTTEIRRLIKILKEILNKKYHNLFQLRNGFYAETVEIDGITKSNYKDFISDRDYKNGHPYNGAYSSIIDNKLWLPMMLNKHPEHLVKTFFFISNKGIFNINTGEKLTIYEFLSTLKRERKLVLKHTHSSIGAGFHLVKYTGNEYIVDDKSVNINLLENFIQNLNEYIVQEYIDQSSYSKNIYPQSVNTIRFQCAWDDENNSFFVARSFHRFGCNGQLVDNVGAGNGMLAYIDVNTGVIENEGVIKVNGIQKLYSGKNNKIVHPDSNIRLDGFSIPGYNNIKEKIIEISNEHPYLNWIGWDVVPTEDGFKIIEANSLTSLSTIQQKEGFLRDRRIKKILKK